MVTLTDKIALPRVPDPDYRIRWATSPDVPFVDHLQRKLDHAISFMTLGFIRSRIARRSYMLIELRGQPAGFVLLTKGIQSPVRIVQHAISEELWRNGYGTLLAAAVARVASAAPHPSITLTCRDGLPSNFFWRAIGSIPVRVSPGGRARKKMLIHYDINPARTLALADSISLCNHQPDPRFEEVEPWSLFHPVPTVPQKQVDPSAL